MKILFLTQWFEPEPILKGIEFAAELQKRGHEVEVVTGFPNYPGGKVYDGYRIKLIQREIIQGVKVTRLPLYPNHSRSALKRIFNYLSFALSAALYCLLFMPKKDVAYVYHPPLTVPVVALLLAKIRKIPYILDIQDLWPDSLSSTGMVRPGRVVDMVSKVASWVYSYASHIFVISPGFKETLKQRGVSSEKISVLFNWVNERTLGERISEEDGARETPQDSIEQDHSSPFKLVFAGSIGLAQGLDIAIAAMHISQNSQINATLDIVGDGVDLERIKNLTKQKNLKNVKFIPRVPMNQISKILSEADGLLVLLKRDPLFERTIPSKTQAYMYAGKPILMAVPGDATNIVLDANCGVVAEPNAESIARAIADLTNKDRRDLDEMGKRGKNFYLQNFSMNVGVNRALAKMHDATTH